MCVHVCRERAPCLMPCTGFGLGSETCGCVCNVCRHTAGLPDTDGYQRMSTAANRCQWKRPLAFVSNCWLKFRHGWSGRTGHNLLYISCIAISTTHLNAYAITLLWSMHALHFFSNIKYDNASRSLDFVECSCDYQGG